MPLNAEQVREAAARRRKTADVEIAEFGTVRIRALSAFDLVRLDHEKQKAILEGRDPQAFAFDYVACSWINDKGEPLFPHAEGIAVAKELDQKDYDSLLIGIARLNGIGEAEIETAIEEAGKN